MSHYSIAYLLFFEGSQAASQMESLIFSAEISQNQSFASIINSFDLYTFVKICNKWQIHNLNYMFDLWLINFDFIKSLWLQDLISVLL